MDYEVFLDYCVEIAAIVTALFVAIGGVVAIFRYLREAEKHRLEKEKLKFEVETSSLEREKLAAEVQRSALENERLKLEIEKLRNERAQAQPQPETGPRTGIVTPTEQEVEEYGLQILVGPMRAKRSATKEGADKRKALDLEHELGRLRDRGE